MSYDGIKENFLSVSEPMQAFKDGTVNVIITSVGTPSSGRGHSFRSVSPFSSGKGITR